MRTTRYRDRLGRWPALDAALVQITRGDWESWSTCGIDYRRVNPTVGAGHWRSRPVFRGTAGRPRYVEYTFLVFDDQGDGTPQWLHSPDQCGRAPPPPSCAHVTRAGHSIRTQAAQ